MACAQITSGRKLPCNDQVGGYKYIDFAPFDEYGFTVANESLAALPVGLTEVFRYHVKATTNTLTETATVSQDTGTSEIVGALGITLTKLDPETQAQVKAMIYGNAIAFVTDYNGNVMLLGRQNGVSGTTGVKQTGGARSDMSGFTVTLETRESEYSAFLSPSAKTALLALISEEVIEP